MHLLMIATPKVRGKDDYPSKMAVFTFGGKIDQHRDVLGAHACARCQGYIERKPVFIISLFESVVRCVNCGRLYRWLNNHIEKYPSDKKEWDEVESKSRNNKENGRGRK